MESMGNEDTPDWLTEMDEEILEALSGGLTLSPSIIAENIDRSREGVSNRLNSLQAGDLVQKVDRGKYSITNEGMKMRLRLRGFEVSEPLNDAEKIGHHREEVEERRLIQRDLGVSKEEYLERAMKEKERIDEEEPDCKEPYEEAFRRVEERLREENS